MEVNGVKGEKKPHKPKHQHSFLLLNIDSLRLLEGPLATFWSRTSPAFRQSLLLFCFLDLFAVL